MPFDGPLGRVLDPQTPSRARTARRRSEISSVSDDRVRRSSPLDREPGQEVLGARIECRTLGSARPSVGDWWSPRCQLGASARPAGEHHPDEGLHVDSPSRAQCPFDLVERYLDAPRCTAPRCRPGRARRPRARLPGRRSSPRRRIPGCSRIARAPRSVPAFTPTSSASSRSAVCSGGSPSTSRVPAGSRAALDRPGSRNWRTSNTAPPSVTGTTATAPGWRTISRSNTEPSGPSTVALATSIRGPS